MHKYHYGIGVRDPLPRSPFSTSKLSSNWDPDLVPPGPRVSVFKRNGAAGTKGCVLPGSYISFYCSTLPL